MSTRRSVSDSNLRDLAHRPAVLWQLGSWFPGLLHLGLAVLIVAEVGFIRSRFDTDRFLTEGGLAGKLLLATRNAAPVGIAALAALVLIGWQSLVREYRLLTTRAQRPVRSVVAFLVHFLVFWVFYGLTQRHFESHRDWNSVQSLWWVCAWALSALAVPFTAACIAFRPKAVLASLLRLLPSLLLATAIGLFAFVMSRVVLESGLWRPIHLATVKLAGGLLWAVTGQQAYGDGPFVLKTGSFAVLVTKDCSGFEGVALITTFLTAYFVLFRRSLRFPHVLVLLPLAVLLEWVANAVRLAALVLIGDRISPEIAMHGFHSYAGWVVFCGLALAIIYASRRISWFAKPALTGPATAAAPMERAETVNPAAVYLGPLLAILAVSFITGAFSSGLDVAYPLRVVAAAAVLWSVRAELPRVELAVSWIGAAYGGAAFLVWIGLERLGLIVPDSSASQGLAGLSPWIAPFWVAFRLLGFVLIAPLAEELAFRGFLARRLVSADFEAVSFRAITPLAWAVSSLAFGIVEGEWIAGTIAGALFALAAIHRGRFGDALVAHVTTNALLVPYYLVVGPRLGWM